VRGKVRGEYGYLLGQLRDLGDHGLVVVGEVPKCLLVLPQKIALAYDCFLLFMADSESESAGSVLARSLMDPNAKPRLGVRNNNYVYLSGISGMGLERSQGREQEAGAGEARGTGGERGRQERDRQAGREWSGMVTGRDPGVEERHS